MANVIVGGIVIALVVFSLVSTVRRSRSGSCCSGCSGCVKESNCSTFRDIEEFGASLDEEE